VKRPRFMQGRKVRRPKRLFKRQDDVVAPVGRDAMAREFGDGNELEDLEGKHVAHLFSKADAVPVYAKLVVNS
jgi:hypothetical protein